MRLFDRRSIIAIDPTSRGFAFVHFDRGLLLDWGERLSRDRRDDLGVLDRLLASSAAEVVVLEAADAGGCRRRERIRRLLRAAARCASRRGLCVIEVARAEVRSGWSARGITPKEAVAAEIARAFQELAAIVPPVRKTGANEDPRVNIFDALSLVLHAVRSEFAP